MSTRESDGDREAGSATDGQRAERAEERTNKAARTTLAEATLQDFLSLDEAEAAKEEENENHVMTYRSEDRRDKEDKQMDLVGSFVSMHKESSEGADEQSHGRFSYLAHALGVHNSSSTSIFSRQTASMIVEMKSFVAFFMCLTFYALFVPDLDLLLGNKFTKLMFSIITTCVFFLFFVELVLTSIGKPNYVGRPYFWLDLVALVSLVPDTVLFHLAFQNNAFVAGRSSRLSRIIRIASKSSKATRLNRLTRLVRVAALMPRLAAFFGKSQNTATNRAIDKKLQRVFACIDENMDGLISRNEMEMCLDRMREHYCATKSKKKSGKGILDKAIRGTQTTNRDSTEGPGADFAPSSILRSNSGDGESSRGKKPVGTAAFADEASTGDFAPTSTARKTETMLFSKAAKSQDSGANDESDFDMANIRSQHPDQDNIGYAKFKEAVLEDETVRKWLMQRVKEQVMASHSMSNITTKHSEDVGVKVALGVLLMLFTLTWVMPIVEDDSVVGGLELLNSDVAWRCENQTAGDPIEKPVREHVRLWMRGIRTSGFSRASLLYLDLDKKVYCDRIEDGQSCTDWHSASLVWGARGTLEDVDRSLSRGEHRPEDVTLLRLPDLSERTNLSPEELNLRTLAVAVFDSRVNTNYEAVLSLITTSVVIVLIIMGVTFLSKDVNRLSKGLILPLKELASDMQSIAQMHVLAFVSNENSAYSKGTSEIRLIVDIFENMKKAIRSWGKYVPWPVVQILLKAGVDARAEVSSKEVTIFFSDIASFTTIVESLQPEMTLLLLSRYFDAMSTVIDEHGGIVIEYIGDAILSVYGAPLRNTDHPAACVRSTMRMLGALKKINEWSSTRGLPELKIRCGVHTGTVFVGNMGFSGRMKYGIVGEECNIPSRLEEINKNYSTANLISQDTAENLDEAEFVMRPIDLLQLRWEDGDADVVSYIYEVLAWDPNFGRTAKYKPHRAAAAQHQQAMEMYRRREFKAAAEAFDEAGALMERVRPGPDVPAAMMAKRCLWYAKPSHAPPANWNGMWDQDQEPP